MLASRKATWILLTWTIAAAVVAYPIHRHNQNVCDSYGCSQTGVAPSFWHPYISVWLIGLAILAIAFAVTRARKHS